MYLEPVLPLNYLCPPRITPEQRNESTISNSRSAFQDQCITDITPDMFNDDKDKMAILSSTLLDIAADNIPKTSPFPKRKAKPWIDEDCQATKKKRNKANRLANKRPSAANSM